uniref:Retrotransposon gag domain-containing protein n=1 Tax=Tanacetum cinerariifolium TaxID=118510 RepID=A0A6L2IZW0_TANCI|nr:hypothetical protein [Tanacetum cinerariifolium]
MSTRSSARNLFPPLDNLDLTIQRRSRADPTLLNDFEMTAEGNSDLPVLDLRTMEELCQPSLNGRGGPIAPIAIQATNFGLKNDIIQQVQNSFQFHGLPGDDANKHLNKFLHVTQSIKVNGVTDDALHLYLFSHSLTHHAIAWFDHLPRNLINTFEQMAKMFLGKYFPPSMVTKLKNGITNFRQHTFYNGLTLRHRDTINAAAGGTFMKRCPEECYDLIENMTAHYNDWDTSAQRSESPSSITSSSDTEIAALKAEMVKINKNLMRALQPPLAKTRTYMLRVPIKKILACCDDDDDYNFAITPNEPVDSLSMGDEHLNTISATKSNEFIKSCVENLVPNPSESKGVNGCDVPTCFTTFLNVLFDADHEFDSSDDQSLYDEDVLEKIFLNPLFEEEIIPMKIDQHHDNVESDLIESMLNRDSSIISSSNIDSLLDEFANELTLLKSIPPGIDETDCDPEEDIRLIERLLYDNSSPRPPKEFVSENSNADIESFSPSPIPVKDSDSFIEEINLSFTLDDPMPSGIEEDDYDSERDILILEELLDNYSLSLLKMSHFILIFLYSLVLLQNHQMLYAKCPMMIHGKNTPILDVPLFHFYPLDQFKYGRNWVKLSDLKQALRGRHPMLIRSLAFSNE